MKLARVVIFAVLCAACATGGAHLPPAVSSRAALRSTIDSMVRQPQFRDAVFGVLIVDPERGDTLYSLNAGKLFMPASNMKIVTGAASLVELGPDYSFRTDFAAGGRVVHDTLQGALIVTGRGDPTISDHMRGSAMNPLYEVADSLRAHGITTIAGGIQAGPDVFPDTSIGFGWSWDDLGEDYGAGVDALYFNEGFGTAIATGKAGMQPDSIRTLPASSYPRIVLPLRSSAQASDTFGLRLDFDPTRTRFTARGRLRNSVDTLTYVFPDQREAYLAALSEALRSRGIVVAGGELRAASHNGAEKTMSASPLFSISSPPLRQVLPALLKPSQNQIAEVLYKTLGLEKTGVGSSDSGRVVLERQLAAWGAESDGYLIRDGSGLSRYGYLSPETLVRVLNKVRADTAFHVFYDALPIAGLDGSLRNRVKGTAAAGRIHAKTGSVANARSLSGYALTADNHVLIFSLLANNWITPTSAVDSVHDRIMVMLASLKLRDAQ
ncbi:MAG: D-alanyl-D-alanine carboxypeptidase/D-alanyl-D-alanine-endopeptidase [Gemmatimonas sp.]|nr:D-alanyl-D-alanine carboxypeptidase/D-alanyl-D-alanine-endopeptidase [Gemmatimonadaceae bacterium]